MKNILKYIKLCRLIASSRRSDQQEQRDENMKRRWKRNTDEGIHLIRVDGSIGSHGVKGRIARREVESVPFKSRTPLNSGTFQLNIKHIGGTQESAVFGDPTLCRQK